MTLEIKNVSHGRYKGQFRFTLKADNNEIIATSEQYVAKQSITELAASAFPSFTVVDKTKDMRLKRNRK